MDKVYFFEMWKSEEEFICDVGFQADDELEARIAAEALGRLLGAEIVDFDRWGNIQVP